MFAPEVIVHIHQFRNSGRPQRVGLGRMGHRCIRHHGIQCCTVSPVLLMPRKDGLLADQLHLSVSYSSMRIQGHCVQEDSNFAKAPHLFWQQTCVLVSVLVMTRSVTVCA